MSAKNKAMGLGIVLGFAAAMVFYRGSVGKG